MLALSLLGRGSPGRIVVAWRVLYRWEGKQDWLVTKYDGFFKERVPGVRVVQPLYLSPEEEWRYE